MRFPVFHLTVAAAIMSLVIAFSGGARAQSSVPVYSPMLQGPLGLNTVPNARMNETGTVNIGVSALDPYAHIYMGMQLADPLFIGLRQTAELSSLTGAPDRFYPGMDIKLRLMKENRLRPAVVIGLQSVLGHKRMSGEYLAVSKRYKDFDFTAGLGWGRLGSAGHTDNPFKFSGESRVLDGEMPAEPRDWFAGNQIGLFGGVEYFTPVKGLSFKFDCSADNYTAEKAALDYDAPPPWSVGVSYWPTSWMNIGLAAQGTDKVMARLSFSGNIKNWRDQNTDEKAPPLMRHFRTGLTLPSEMEIAAAGDGVILSDTKNAGAHSVSTRLKLVPGSSTPQQVGRAARYIANHGGPETEELAITPSVMGLRGPTVRLMRADLERALIRHQGSADEIWRSAEFTDDDFTFKKFKRPAEVDNNVHDAFFTLDTQLSLAEEDNGVLYRTSLLAGARNPLLFGALDSGFSFRWNIEDNLKKLYKYRDLPADPVRSDVDFFAARTLALDTLYATLTHSLRPDLHAAVTAGYLEEMYAGMGGEILYRPFDSHLAFGAEAWQAFKREPRTAFNLGFYDDTITTGHLNAWYDVPDYDLTLNARIGRYLAGDVGFTASLQKKFKNGAMLEGFITVTDQADLDLFGGTTHAYNGLRLSVPLGGFKHIPDGAQARITTASLGRDTGQTLDKPIALYEVTEPFSAAHMIRHWDEVLR